MSKVFLIRDNFLQKLELALKKIGIELIRDNVVVKAHMGEYGNLNYVRPPIVGRIVEIIKSVGGKPILFDSPTLYPGSRSTPEKYLETARRNGFTQETIGCPIVISDKGRLVEINATLKEVEVVDEVLNSSYIVTISHVKGHEMVGFGGAIKNIGMGCVTKKMKGKIHNLGRHVDLQKLLAESTYAVLKNFKRENWFFVNVLIDIAPLCDCEANPGLPICEDIGILVSKDPVAIDSASLDLIENIAKKDVFFQLHKINPRRIVDYGEGLGLGSKVYELEKIS